MLPYFFSALNKTAGNFSNKAFTQIFIEAWSSRTNSLRYKLKHCSVVDVINKQYECRISFYKFAIHLQVQYLYYMIIGLLI